jgi:hypothetical protein
VRYAIWAAVGLILGLVVGGLGPRARVRGLESEIAELEERDCSQRGVGRDLATMFGGLGGKAPPTEEDEIEDPEPLPSGTQAVERHDREGVVVEFGTGDEGEGREEDVTPEQAMEMARAGLELRRTQARASLLEDADPDDEQLAEIDAAVTAMNEDLMTLATDLVTHFEEQGEPSRHDAMVFAADALDIVLDAEEGITGALDAEQLEAVQEEAVDPFSYIDPSLLEMLGQLD